MTAVPPRPNQERLFPILAGVAIVSGLLLLLFWPTLCHLATMWWLDPSYSHGFLILPLSVAIAVWIARNEAGSPGAPEVFSGVVLLGLGSIAHGLGLLFRWPLVDFLALVFMIRGTAILFGGHRWADHFRFPTLFLFFMFPLPATWTGAMSIWLQDNVAYVSSGILNVFSVCYRQGNALFVAGLDRPLHVAHQCSGLRQLVAFFAFGSILAFVFRQWSGVPRWVCVVFVASALPVAILANVLRVVLMAVGMRYFGGDWTDTWMHHIPATITLPLGLALFLLTGLLLKQLASTNLAVSGDGIVPETTNRRANMEREKDVGQASNLSRKTRDGFETDPTDNAHPPENRVKNNGWVVASVCLAVGVLGQFALQRHLTIGTTSPFPTLRKQFAFLPPTMRTPLFRPDAEELVWRSKTPSNHDQIREELPFHADDFLIRYYHESKTQSVLSLYLVHSRTGEDRKHHPEICIRDVLGAPEDVNARKRFYLGGNREQPVQRFRFRTASEKDTTVYYWHYTFRRETRGGQTILQQIHDRRVRSAPSITVQVATTASGEQLAQIEKSFLVALDRRLQQHHLPPDTLFRCDRLRILLFRD
ncbi:MAG: exosortase/archaeosortase family protein [Gemmataceae bacterium]